MSDSVPSSRPVPPSSSAVSPTLLALDTATEHLHIALVAGAADGAVRTRALPGGAQASAGLLPALQALLDDAGLRWADVDAIAFGSGPGAFTGLRTACSVTQGLALGLGCPVIALDTLMAVAAWLIWRRGGFKKNGRVLRIFLLQLVLNAAWTPLFFGLRLGLWYATLFVLGAIVIVLLTYYLTSVSLAQRDRQIIQGKAIPACEPKRQ